MSEVAGSARVMAPLLRGARHRAARRDAAAAAAAPVPAVVVGAVENGGGLGLVRSLGAAGVPVTVVDTDAWAPAMGSRFARKAVLSRMSGPSLVSDLLALEAASAAAPVLFLTTDDAVLTVSAHRTELARRFRFRLPAHEHLLALTNKARFQRVAETLGFPVPRSVRIESAADLARLAELRYPCIVKPTVKTADYVARRFAPAYRAVSIAQARAACERILPVVPDLLVQEWIAGTDGDLYFCLQYRANGATVGSFTGRKLSIWPPDVGTTASCTAAPEAHAALTSLTEAFFAAVLFDGIGGIEFKRDARTGRFLLIEPTVGRVDWQEEVATLNGANIPLAAYCYETGREIPPAGTPPVPTIWRDRGRHWKAARRGGRALPVPPRARVLDAYWRAADPMPALLYAARAVLKRVRKAARRRRD